jgi:colicin import membrane protein
MTGTAETVETTEIATLPPALTAVAVFGAANGVTDVLDKIRREVSAVKTDISTKAGRAQVASLARKVASSKTALDEMGKEMVVDLKERAGRVDAERRRIRTELDKLRDEVRRPLTEWEDTERARVAAHEDALCGMEDLLVFRCEATEEEIVRRLSAIRVFSERDWQEFRQRHAETSLRVSAGLSMWLEKVRREAAERIEREQREAALEERERARVEKAEERARLEREERIAREAAERAALEERERARAEILRVEIERRAAERREQEARAAAVIAERKRIAVAEQAERARKEEAAAQVIRERLAEERATREKEAAVAAERKRIADEAEKAEADRRWRENCEERRREVHVNMTVALAQVIEPYFGGLNTPWKAAAADVVEHIAAGKIPHVRIEY